MIDMLCSFPAPCGNEEILKKYIIKKYPNDWYEDSIGNLILHKSGSGLKIMIYCGLDEDSFLVMSKNNNELYFNHFGKKTLYPGLNVTFGGYIGEVLTKNKGNPLKEQYIRLISDHPIDQGSNGIADLEFYQDETVIYAKEAAKRVALCALLNSLDIKTDKDIYFVLGVQDNNNYKGLINATNEIEPDEVYAFEETAEKEISYLCTVKGYMATNSVKEKAKAIADKAGVKLITEINSEKVSVSSYANSPLTLTFGIPVSFEESFRQATDIKYINTVSNLIKAILQ